MPQSGASSRNRRQKWSIQEPRGGLGLRLHDMPGDGGVLAVNHTSDQRPLSHPICGGPWGGDPAPAPKAPGSAPARRHAPTATAGRNSVPPPVPDPDPRIGAPLGGDPPRPRPPNPDSRSWSAACPPLTVPAPPASGHASVQRGPSHHLGPGSRHNPSPHRMSQSRTDVHFVISLCRCAEYPCQGGRGVCYWEQPQWYCSNLHTDQSQSRSPGNKLHRVTHYAQRDKEECHRGFAKYRS